MSDQPKPTTGEWTAATVEKIIADAKSVSEYPSDRLAAAHNAALRNAQPFLDEALKQLSAEREKAGAFVEASGKALRKFQKQLAAEKLKVYEAVSQEKAVVISEVIKLRAQLADESERCEVCNTELSQCGPQGVDGEPSMDCLVCKLREQLTGLRKQILMELRPFELRSQVQTLEQQLAAEREQSVDVEGLKNAARTIQHLREQLAAAQAAIVHYNDAIRPLGQPKIPTDTTALDAAIAAAQQPLVELLKKVDTMMYRHIGDDQLREEIKAQLAKVEVWK